MCECLECRWRESKALAKLAGVKGRWSTYLTYRNPANGRVQLMELDRPVPHDDPAVTFVVGAAGPSLHYRGQLVGMRMIDEGEDLGPLLARSEQLLAARN